MPHSWLYTLSGLLVGFLVGMTGVGGGSLMTPLLILLFGVKPQSAVGTDLLYAAITKIFGTALNRHHGVVRWRIVLLQMAGSLPAGLLCLIFLRHYGPSPFISKLITEVLGVALLLTVPAILFKPWLQKWSANAGTLRPQTVDVLTIVLGVVLGTLVTLSSVGAGAIGMAALTVLYPRVSTRELVATDIAHAVPLALLAGGGHWLQGAVDSVVLVELLMGSIPGILLGTLLAGRLPEDAQRWFLGILLAIIGLRMI
ncbi:sulfite exporter TauE/SafE family protein [Gluconobacter kondonii]|uniref:Probable membrane transporter protein n=1 Tax=Gluconobacter kondonii TaxID=941463 RepID=A0ABQ5WN54_9PROT|nr:sulfite exporter TauE/SafE family protein [Gluconobacter kondonii]MBS1052258.1 sulfite exporter TauE/SafE family protein [Gluconobacter kondonii]MBS1055512.1 sulfite exporter TauE/SafE family protein [Gluconobacter kondonii]MBS1064645.1 sulfite exporter TauE/SafE family protein [Gluconobacter kondonii]MBS1076259.1 sulfite exporter TauE/SafE family protein [Gluconobacter kondonii]MBS1079470.1 sulfite exporter TauE/SafE family protein [Gluconobacter kondonii]